MEMLIKKKISDLIIPESINFNELVKNSDTKLSLDCQSKMVELLNQEFTEEESQFYIASLMMYLNYHPTVDFPVNLEHVFHMIGFANKGNAKRTLENNFTLNEDYKILSIKNSDEKQLLRTEKLNKSGSGILQEDIMLNVDTMKHLFLIAKTPEGKKARKYFIKIENINHKVLQMEMEESKIIQAKLLEEKDKCIAQLKEQESVSILYIAHNPIVKNKMKIGISSETKSNDILVRFNTHRTSNPDFTFLFTYETPNAKQIEHLIKTLLKPFRLQSPEWFSISYERIKQVVDFAIMMYDNYHINESVDNLIEFVSRYRSNRLINTNKARIHITKDIYEEWFKENSIMIPNAKISTEIICNDFYEWYKLRHTNTDNSHIKLDSGNWSTSFQKEITNTISEITNLEYKQSLSFSDRKRGIYFPKCAGFIGFEVKSMNNKMEFFDTSVYETYVKTFITVTNNSRHKVARKELLDDFLNWVKNENYISKNKIMCRTAISSIFKDVLINNIESITGKSVQNICKMSFFGCFIGISHSKFQFLGNESPIKEQITNTELIKKHINNWVNDKTTKISKVFHKTIQQNNLISDKDVKLIMQSKHNKDISSCNRKTHYHLIFNKAEQGFIISQEAFEYYNTLL